MNSNLNSDRSSGNVRQPVSCEPCRKRKIKCSRTHPPCDTCRRRRCAESCLYKAQHDGQPATPSTVVNQDLLTRISNLEQMLRKHTELAADECAVQNTPVIAEHQHTSQLSPESLTSENLSYLTPPDERPQPVGHLKTSPSGNIQYQPQRSQWTSVLANTNLSIGTPSLDDQDTEDFSTGFPLSSSPSSTGDLLSLLPPVQQCERLKNTYFAVFSPLFHILHDPTFHARYEEFVEAPSSASVSWLAILFVILGLAVTALDDDDPLLKDLGRSKDPAVNIRMLSKRYREAAMACLSKQGVFWGRHNLQSLQALIMLGYALGHCQEHTWVLLGMTHHIAIAMALHVDPENFDLDLIQSEERRRCWAGLKMLYTIQNTIIGNPDPNWHIKNDVKLPADVNDIDITLSGIQQSFAGPTQMSYLLFKFQLYDLTAEICTETFGTSSPSRTKIQSIDNQICIAQQTWDSRYLADTNIAALPNHHAVHLHILHAYSHQLFLLLHRPFFAQSILGFDIPNESQIRCIASAEALLDIYQTLSETPEFALYRWYTQGLGSFHAFHGAAVLAVALLMPIYKPQYKRFQSVLHRTVSLFERSSGRSRICEKVARILRFLMSAASPNQEQIQPISPIPGGPHNSLDIGSGQLKLFADRMDPQQWLAPSSMAWNEWEAIMATDLI